MLRPKSLALGAAAFLAVHVAEAHGWHRWFDASGLHEPWFLNSGRAAAVMVAVLALTAAIFAVRWARSAREAALVGLNLAGGACPAMAATLFAVGPGTIFPIVLVVAAGLIVLGCVTGAWLGFAATSALRGRRRSS